jgi:predicted O-linked N-acetylglucosamine transferase (SPINDLY family)
LPVRGMTQLTIQQAFDLALKHQQAGRLQEAEQLYRQILAQEPKHADAMHFLGVIAHHVGRYDDAVELIRRAIALWPNYAQAYSNLGNALKDKGQLDEAIATYRQAIALNPNLPEAHYNLGNVLKNKGQIDEAIAAFRQAIALRPNYAEAHYNLGDALGDKGQFDEAVAAFLQAIALNPNLPEAHGNLGNALREKGQLDSAIVAYRRAIALRPNYSQAHNNLGNALMETGRLDEAINSYRRAIQLKPYLTEPLSNLLFLIQYHPGYGAAKICAEARHWNQQHAEPLKKFIQPHTNDRDPERRLRVGYVGANFQEHCQSFFLLPLFSHHDRNAFELFCYSRVSRTDAIAAQIGGMVTVMRPITGLTDQSVADRIRADQIDVLVDLTMHMSRGCALIFARKPAPVQVAWLAYPGTTGLDAMDYRLTDPHLDPPGVDHLYSEKSVRLPETFWCYDPLCEDIDPQPLPAIENGFITFGSLNNFCKVNEGVLRLWGRVLKAVDRSRLIILCPEGSHRQTLLELLQRDGVRRDRIELVVPRPRRAYLDLYHRIDLGLDTFPYNGHTTSLDSFWMGVPVITLVGQTVVGRAGLSQLTNLGLIELAARMPEQFVEIVANLARDLPRLAELRRTLRARMQASPLMDAPRFARNIEAAYQQMWRNWCAQGGNSSLQCPAP